MMTTQKTTQALSKTLAEEYILQLKTQNFHWNVEGPLFFSLHKLFESQYIELQGSVARIAEVLRAHQVKAPGSFRDFIKVSLIDEAPLDPITSHQMIEILNKDHVTMASRLREFMEDAEGENDSPAITLYEDLITFHEKAAWMIRSHRA